MSEPLVLVPTAREAESLLRTSLPGPPRRLTFQGVPLCAALTGVGPVAAAALASRWLAEVSPGRVLLLGTAGSYDEERAPPASVVIPEAVLCHGIGAGEGQDFVPLALPAMPEGILDGDGDGALLLDPASARPAGARLLTVTASAASAAEVARRRRSFPQVLAEDMESFAVALAARLHGVPCTVARAISNAAGDRDPRRWCLEEAMRALRGTLVQWLGDPPR